ncbi:MAG: hypothetical protein R2788_09880 [Saprospiraceae bacterium]
MYQQELQGVQNGFPKQPVFMADEIVHAYVLHQGDDVRCGVNRMENTAGRGLFPGKVNRVGDTSTEWGRTLSLIGLLFLLFLAYFVLQSVGFHSKLGFAFSGFWGINPSPAAAHLTRSASAMAASGDFIWYNTRASYS